LSSAKQYVKRIIIEREKSAKICLDDTCFDGSFPSPVTTTVSELPTSVWESPTSVWESHIPNTFQFPNFKEVSDHPFIIRDVVSYVGGNLGSFTDDELSAVFGQHGVDFYPQNMRIKPSKVYVSTVSDALDYLSYPEGAYLTVDASEPGAYLQWNMNQTVWNALIQHSLLKALPSLLVDSLDAVFYSLMEASGVTIPSDELIRLQHAFALKTHWYMLLAGEEGSGMFRHQDTIPVGSWQIQMVGSKRWTICPPQTSPSAPPAPCVEAVARPGDLIYYPPHFWHETLNLDTPSISLSGTLVGDRSVDGAFVAMLRDECAHNSRGFSLDQRLCSLVMPRRVEL
jgi:hypothetical protein